MLKRLPFLIDDSHFAVLHSPPSSSANGSLLGIWGRKFLFRRSKTVLGLYPSSCDYLAMKESRVLPHLSFAWRIFYPKHYVLYPSAYDDYGQKRVARTTFFTSFFRHCECLIKKRRTRLRMSIVDPLLLISHFSFSFQFAGISLSSFPLSLKFYSLSVVELSRSIFVSLSLYSLHLVP